MAADAEGGTTGQAAGAVADRAALVRGDGTIVWSDRPSEAGRGVAAVFGADVAALAAAASRGDHGRRAVRTSGADGIDRWTAWQALPAPDGALLLGRDETEARTDREVGAAERRILHGLVDGEALEPLLASACRALEALVPDTRCSVMLASADGRTMRAGAGPSLSAAYRAAVEGLPAEAHVGTCGPAIATGAEVVTEDIRLDPNWAAFLPLAEEHRLRSCWSQPLRGRGRVLGTFAVYRDRPWAPSDRERAVARRLAGVVTATLQHREAEEALRRARIRAVEADRAKTTFLAQVSHELRTPLNAVIGYAEAMDAGIWGPIGDPRYRDYAAAIAHAGAHLLALVNQLLDLSRIEAGERRLSPSLVPLGAALRDAWALASNARPGAEVRLSVDGGAGDAQVLADPDAVRQILVNVLGNAVKFSPDGGEIRVAARAAGDRTAIEVADDGPGMSAETLARIARGRSPLETADVSRGQGAGIGLRITQHLVSLHGGRLSFESAPGAGTRVSIELPRGG